MGRLSLLSSAEPDPVNGYNLDGKGHYILCCEHAGNRFPESLGNLGLSQLDTSRHIAWDIGANALTKLLAKRLDCPAVLQRYSRLVYDCNRAPDHPQAFVVNADGSRVEGNTQLSAKDKLLREKTIYRPFHNLLSQLCDQKQRLHVSFSFISIHSFNPVLGKCKRPHHIGMIYNQNDRLSKLLITWFKNHTQFNVGDNEPYSPVDSVDHTIRVQAESKQIPYSMIEIRNDLLQTKKNINDWTALLAQALTECR